MPLIAYPAGLPAPSTLELTPTERRARSGLADGPEKARARERDFGAAVPLTWGVMTRAELATFRAWGDGEGLGDLMHWSRRFAVTLPGRGGFLSRVCRFKAPPRHEYLAHGEHAGLYRVSAEVYLYGRAAPPAIRAEVDLDAMADAGLSSAVGITLTGFDPAATYTLSLPAGRTFTGWSRLSSGATWRNEFVVTSAAGDTTFGGGTYATGEAARAAFPGGTLTGHDTYTFWLFDNLLTDNRGGLSILVQ